MTERSQQLGFEFWTLCLESVEPSQALLSSLTALSGWPPAVPVPRLGVEGSSVLRSERVLQQEICSDNSQTKKEKVGACVPPTPARMRLWQVSPPWGDISPGISGGGGGSEAPCYRIRSGSSLLRE